MELRIQMNTAYIVEGECQNAPERKLIAFTEAGFMQAT